ncbi:MAG TPA: hypothetical protein VI136_02440 [Verrucomicrobiae bacterium]
MELIRDTVFGFASHQQRQFHLQSNGWVSLPLLDRPDLLATVMCKGQVVLGLTA